jgi:hypothetical protein
MAPGPPTRLSEEELRVIYDQRYVDIYDPHAVMKVDVLYLPHWLSLASRFNFLGALPLVGRHFRARLFLTCWKDS